MNTGAIQHINSRYRHQDTYITPDGNVGIRITVGCDIKSVVLVYNDPYFWNDGGWQSKKTEMHYVGIADGLKKFAVEVPCPTKRVKYYFLLDDGNSVVQLTEAGLTKDYSEAFLPCFFIPYVDNVAVFRQPEWVKNTVWYQIMPARFANEAGHGTGTLKGIIAKLDYLAELGINGLYLNPIYKAASYHKYDVIDYTEIAEDLGSKKDFCDLCNAAHARGMKVMLDISLTHCSSQNLFWQDVLKNGKNSPYYQWFRVIHQGECMEYETFAFEKSMPKFNTEKFELIVYFMNHVINYWMHNAGIDAWRIDVANEISDRMLKNLKRTVRNNIKDGYIVGEIWHNGTEWIDTEKLDGVTNYALSRAILSFVNSPEHSMEKYQSDINKIICAYSPEQLAGCMTLLDSHDTQRIRTTFCNDKRKFKLALVLLMTFYGTPSLYYGTERYMAGGPDPDCRRFPDWEDDSQDVRDVYGFIQRLITLRRMHQVLANDSSLYWWDIPGVLAYERHGKERILIIVNCNDERCFVQIPIDKGRKYQNLFNEDMVPSDTYIDPYGFMLLAI